MKEFDMNEFPNLAEELRSKGVVRAHVTAVAGADPQVVEREWAQALHMIEHGACIPTRMNYDSWVEYAFGWVMGHFRTIKYKLLHKGS